MLSGIRGKLVRALPFVASATARRVLRCRHRRTLVLLAVGLTSASACVPLTPEALLRVEQHAYQQAEREARFFSDKRTCDEFGGFIVIERYGRASRRDEVRRVPGARDRWFCRR